MTAFAIATLFALVAVFVSLSLVDSALRARRSLRRLQSERRLSGSWERDVTVTVVHAQTSDEAKVVALPARPSATAIRALRPLAAAA